VTVYNISIEEKEEYYVEDILVHNCTDCASLQGRVFTIEEIRPLIPLHTSCRCVAVPFLPGLSKSEKFDKSSIGKEYYDKKGRLKPKRGYFKRKTTINPPKRRFKG